MIGIVHSVPEAEEGSSPAEIKEGDKVLFAKYGATEVSHARNSPVFLSCSLFVFLHQTTCAREVPTNAFCFSFFLSFLEDEPWR